MNKVFIPKDNQELPDNFGMKVFYLDGKIEEFELAHYFPLKDGILEFWTKDDVCYWLILSNVKRIEFDKRFSKIVAIRNEMNKKKGGE